MSARSSIAKSDSSKSAIEAIRLETVSLVARQYRTKTYPGLLDRNDDSRRFQAGERRPRLHRSVLAAAAITRQPRPMRPCGWETHGGRPDHPEMPHSEVIVRHSSCSTHVGVFF